MQAAEHICDFSLRLAVIGTLHLPSADHLVLSPQPWRCFYSCLLAFLPLARNNKQFVSFAL
jgi:hypothetical protein